MSKKELETLVIKYRAQKEHIDAVKAAVKNSGLGLEGFFHYCVGTYLDEFRDYKRIPLPGSLFSELSSRARELRMPTTVYANYLLTREMKREKANQRVLEKMRDQLRALVEAK